MCGAEARMRGVSRSSAGMPAAGAAPCRAQRPNAGPAWSGGPPVCSAGAAPNARLGKPPRRRDLDARGVFAPRALPRGTAGTAATLPVPDICTVQPPKRNLEPGNGCGLYPAPVNPGIPSRGIPARRAAAHCCAGWRIPLRAGVAAPYGAGSARRAGQARDAPSNP